jgi:cell volume regulation protein A
VDCVNIPLLAAAVLVFASALACEDGPGGCVLNDVRLSFWVGNIALAVILLDGGLRTAYATFRTGLKPAALLATVGVLVTAALTGLAAMLLLDLDLPTALLLGAIVGSTDAAAVFALLGRSGVTLNERVAATLEIESGVNDPMAIYLTLACIALVAAAARGEAAGAGIAIAFVQQFGWGTMAGVASGVLMALLLRRVASRDAGGGILALLLVAGGLSVFAATGTIGGSGFLAVYLFGMIVANRAISATRPTLPAMDGYAWLAQAGMFLLLGLLVTPSQLLPQLLPSAGGGAGAHLRGAADWRCGCACGRCASRARDGFSSPGSACAVPCPSCWRMFPLLAGTAQAPCCCSTPPSSWCWCSLLVQGGSIGWVARRLGVALPDPTTSRRARAVFRDFALDPQVPLADVCAFYGLPEPPHAERPVAVWMTDALKRPPVVGDAISLGPATPAVREMAQGRITGVGLGLPK